jgi:hypothetical protein
MCGGLYLPCERKNRVKDTDKCVVGLFLGKNEILLTGDNYMDFFYLKIYFLILTH